MSQLFFDPRPIMFGPNGMPLNQGRLWFYASGTSQLLTVYTDEAMSVPAPNPVYLDASGRVPEIFFGSGTYKIICEGVTTQLPVPARTTSDATINVTINDRSITSTYTYNTIINLRSSLGNYSQITIVAGTAGATIIPSGTDTINSLSGNIILSPNQRWSITDTATGNWTSTTDNYVQIWTADEIIGNSSGIVSTAGNLAVVNTISAIKSLDPSLYPYVMTLGSAGAYDGGGGIYSWVSSSTNADDNGWYIQRSTGGAGRWVRTILATENALDIRIWGAVTNIGPIDTQVSNALSISSNLGLPVYFPQGVWKFQGTVTNIASTGGSVIFADGARIDQITVGTININLPLSILSQSIPLQGATAPNIVFGALSGLYNIKSHWMNSTSLAYSCNNSNLDLYIEKPITFSNYVGITITKDIIIGETATVSFGFGNILSTSGKIIVNGSRRRIFFEYDDTLTRNTSSVLLSTKQEFANAWWFGWSFISGNDQSIALLRAQYALTFNNVTPAILNIDALSSGQYVNNTTTPPATSNVINVNVQYPIATQNGFVFGPWYVNNLPTDQLIQQNTGSINIVNDVIYPEWFGASTSLSDNINAINAMIACSKLYSSVIEGNYNNYSISSSITVPSNVGWVTWNMNNIGISKTASNSTPVISCDQVQLLWKDVNINTPLGTTTNASVSLTNLVNAYLNHCSFTGPTIMSSYPYSVVNNNVNKCMFIGNGISHTFMNVYGSSTLSVRECDFNTDPIIVISDGSTGYITDINLCDNILTLSGTTASIVSDILISTSTAETKITGLRITNNLFKCPSGTYTPKINPQTTGAGTWQSSQDSILIKDNIFDLFTGSTGSNYCRATEGKGILTFSPHPNPTISGMTYAVFLDPALNKPMFFLDASNVTYSYADAFYLLGTPANSTSDFGRFRWNAQRLAISSGTKWYMGFNSDITTLTGNNLMQADWRIYS